MRKSPLERFIWGMAIVFPVAFLGFGLVLYMRGARWRHQPPTAWRAAPDLERNLMATEFARSGELLGWTRAEVVEAFGEPASIEDGAEGAVELVYDAGPDGLSDRKALRLSVDATGRVVQARN